MEDGYNMKKILFILLAALTISACGEKESTKVDITGEWVLSDVHTKAVSIGGDKVEVYVSFEQDGHFTIYQKIGSASARFTKFEGTWTLGQDNFLRGKYSDNVQWGDYYSVERQDNVLRLTKQMGDEVNVFSKTNIPEELKGL